MSTAITTAMVLSRAATRCRCVLTRARAGARAGRATSARAPKRSSITFARAPSIGEPSRRGRTSGPSRWWLTGVTDVHRLTPMPMKKTQIYLPEDELRALHRIAHARRRGVADLVREAIRGTWLA